MKRESRLFVILGLGAFLLATSNSAMAQREPREQSGRTSSTSPASSTAAPAPGTVTNQTMTTESTTTAVPTDMMTTETTSFDNAPLANTGGEPWMFVLGGLALAASALMFRRRVGSNA